MQKVRVYWRYSVVIVVIGLVAAGILFYALSSDKTTAQVATVAPTTIPSTPTTAADAAALAALTNTPADPTYKYIYANATNDQKQAAAARGTIAFRNWCDSCHPHGQVGYGPALWGNQVVMTPAQVFQRIRLGDDRERSRFAQLSQVELNDIIAYIQEQERVVNSAS